MSIRINNKIISGVYANQSYRYVGEIFQSTLPINDSRVALLDGHKIYESEGYGSFIQYITSLALLYPQLACTEDEWQLSDTTYGECGKFVISEDGVRLPKIVSFVQGLSSLQDLATLVEAGLPNITGTVWKSRSGGYTSIDGAFYYEIVNDADGTGGSAPTAVTVHMDASRSNPIYGNSPTVQPQSIRYPYYIVLATGVTQEVKVKEELMTNIPFTLFESKYSEVELNNTSWLLSSGQWNSKSLYPSAYNELVKEYNAGSNKYSIKLHTDEYDDYDFVLNLDDETFRLPLLDGSESLPQEKLVSLNLQSSPMTYQAPFNGWVRINGKSTANYGYVQLYNERSTGILSQAPATNALVDASLFVSKGDFVNVIYANVTVNAFFFIPAKGNGSLYFYVGDTNINASLVDTGKLTQEVANLIPNNSSLIANFGLPSGEYIDITIGANGSTYTMPENGYLFILYVPSNSATESQGAFLVNKTLGDFGLTVFNIWGRGAYGFLPVRKNDVIEINYGNTIKSLKLYKLKGEV